MTTTIAQLAPVTSDENMATFVGDKYASYYQQKWQLNPGQFTGFNIAAFFLGGVWLIYRKMYLYAIIFFTIITIDIVIEMFYPLPELIGKAVTWGVAVMFGVLGNHWYRTHTLKKISQINTGFASEQVPAELARQGGTNLLAAVITTIILLSLVGVGIWAIYSGKL